ncbi:hypothetical protein D3C76_1700890 [compost metagenome]
MLLQEIGADNRTKAVLQLIAPYGGEAVQLAVGRKLGHVRVLVPEFFEIGQQPFIHILL